MFQFAFSWQLRMLNVLFTYCLAFAHFLKCLFSPFIHLLNGLVRLRASKLLSSLLVCPKFPLQCRSSYTSCHPICRSLLLCPKLLDSCSANLAVPVPWSFSFCCCAVADPTYKSLSIFDMWLSRILVLFSPMNIWHLCQKLSGVLYGLTSWSTPFSCFEACTILFVLLCLYSTVLNWVW